LPLEALVTSLVFVFNRESHNAPVYQISTHSRTARLSYSVHPFGSREGIPDTKRFRDKELIYKALYKFAYFTFTLLFVRVE